MREAAPPFGRRDPPRRRLRLLWWLLGLLVVGAVFAIGVALGEALHDNPSSGGGRTYVRTLQPLPLAPAPYTVTVTETAR